MREKGRGQFKPTMGTASSASMEEEVEKGGQDASSQEAGPSPCEVDDNSSSSAVASGRSHSQQSHHFHEVLCPMKVSMRISACFLLCFQALNLVFCSVLLSTVPDVSVKSTCAENSRLMYVSHIALSALRLLLMLLSATLTYNAGRAAVHEAAMGSKVRAEQEDEDEDKEDKEGVARHVVGTRNHNDQISSLVSARAHTQRQYDRLLLVNAFVEPVFLLLQLGFFIAFLVIFVQRWSNCILFQPWRITLSILAIATQWLFVCLRLAFGSRVISWRGIFGFELDAWEKHYQERIEHILRFIMCCVLGKPKYLTVSKSVLGRVPHPVAIGMAKLFDFKAYGTADMLEFFRAMDHIRRIDNERVKDMRNATISQLREEYENNSLLHSERHQRLLLEACSFIRFSSAAYTGYTHDLLRVIKHKNPFLTFRRQEMFRSVFQVMSPGKERNKEDDAEYSRGVVQGDTFWNGHTKAFARYANVAFDDVIAGRVGHENKQVRPEGMSSLTGLCTYFVTRCPEQKILVISIRGTADMEDVLTDAHAFEGCVLPEDVGLKRDNPVGKRGCGWAHYGVLQATREVYKELMGKKGEPGLLPNLMSTPTYSDWGLRIVGQSLGSAVASLLTLRLRKHYPNIHCFAYNPWPVVDETLIESIGENVCKSLVTQIVYNEDIVSRLTFPNVMKLHDRVCSEIIEIQQNPWKGENCLLCCPDLRGFCASCNCACKNFCYCFHHINDHLETTMDKRGRCVKSPNYVISTKEELESHMESARMLDCGRMSSDRNLSPQAKSKSVKSAFRPVAMKLETKTNHIRPDLYKSSDEVGESSVRSLNKSKVRSSTLQKEFNFPLESLSQKEFENRWQKLRKSTKSLRKSSFLERHGFSFKPKYTAASQTTIAPTLVSLRFSGISYVLFGNIVHVRSCRDEAGKSSWIAVEEAPETYNEIILGDNMFVDHMPWHLEHGLHMICEKMNANHLKSKPLEKQNR